MELHLGHAPFPCLRGGGTRGGGTRMSPFPPRRRKTQFWSQAPASRVYVLVLGEAVALMEIPQSRLQGSSSHCLSSA